MTDPTEPDGDTLPTLAELAWQYNVAISALATHLDVQAREAQRAGRSRQLLAAIEADVTLEAGIDGKNEAIRKAQVIVALRDRNGYLLALADAGEAEHERDLAAAAAEVARERIRYARTLLGLSIAQTQAGIPAAPAASPSAERTLAYQQGFDAACIAVLDAGRNQPSIPRAIHGAWLQTMGSLEDAMEVVSQVTADAVGHARLAARARERAQ